jgi:hypothetical protein
LGRGKHFAFKPRRLTQCVCGSFWRYRR